MSNKVKISVIVPAYNAEKYLTEALLSIVKQKMHGIEVLVINDGSTDGTQSIIDTFTSKYGYFRSVLQQNSGVAAARNKGIDKANGRYIAFLDADDVYAPGALKAMYRIARHNKAELVVGGIKIFDAFGMNEISKKMSNLLACRRIGHFNKNNLVTFSASSRLFLRKKILEGNHQFADMEYGEDAVFSLPYMYSCSKIYSCGEVVLYYRKHSFLEDLSVTQKVSRSYLDNCVESYRIVGGHAVKKFCEYLSSKYKLRGLDGTVSALRALYGRLSKRYWLVKLSRGTKCTEDDYLNLNEENYFNKNLDTSVWVLCDSTKQISTVTKMEKRVLKELIMFGEYLSELLFKEANVIINQFYRNMKNDVDCITKLIIARLMEIRNLAPRKIWNAVQESNTDLDINNLDESIHELVAHPHISVAVVSFEKNSKLIKTIKSVLAQTMSHVEIFLPITTLEYLKENVPGIGTAYITAVKADTAAQFKNMALVMAKGEYMLFTNDNYFYKRTAFVKFYDLMRTNKANIGSCRIYRYSCGKISEYASQALAYGDVAGTHILNDEGFLALDCHLANKVIRTSFLRRHEFAIPSCTVLDEKVRWYKHEGMVFGDDDAVDALVLNRSEKCVRRSMKLVFARCAEQALMRSVDTLRPLLLPKQVNLLDKQSSLLQEIKAYNDLKKGKKTSIHTTDLLLDLLVVYFVSRGLVYKKKVNKKKFIKKFVLLKMLLPVVYRLYAWMPLKDNMVAFADFRFQTMPTNMQPIYDELKRQNYDVVAVLKLAHSPIRILAKYAKLFSFLEFTKCYAQAKYVVVGDYYPPLYTNKPRKGQKIIQVWHGAGAFKKYGYSTVGKAWGMSSEELKYFPIHNTYTHVVVSSKDVMPCHAEALNMSDDKIYPYGFPRSDAFFDETYRNNSSSKLLKLFPQAVGKKILLYSPTFRGTSTTKAYSQDEIDYEMLRRKLSHDYVLVTKFHPLAATATYSKNVHQDFAKNIVNEMETNELLCCADILITDYSSLVFEYSLLERPMIFFAYDLEDYDDGRGFYYDYEEFVPGPIVKDNESLVQAILNVDRNFNIQEMRDFKLRFMGACDGNSTKRIVQSIFTKE